VLRDAINRRVLKGAEAARLRQRQYTLLRRFRLPVDLDEMLPGSLTLSYTRCGKPTCHCAQGQGHPSWTLTFMVEGRRRVERVPREWADEVRRRVEAGRALQEAVRDVLATNAQLFVLARKRRRR
jgi:hypothetical protein